MNRKKLKLRLRTDRMSYPDLCTTKSYLYAMLCNDRNYYTYKYVKALRYTEYYYSKKNNLIYRILYILWKRKKNKLGGHISLDIGENAFESGLYIAHRNIIVGSCKVGKNCKLHGDNCIGSGAKIGDNCELWVGAKVFGPAKLGDNITVAAGAIVIDSFEEQGITIAGVPAKKIK